jgi:hypothetical protein
MERLEGDARRRVGRQEQAAWLEISDGFVRELQALHHAIITRAERFHADAVRAADNAERDFLAERAKALQEAHEAEQAEAVPVERHIAATVFHRHVANRRQHERRVLDERDDSTAMVAQRVQARAEADARRLEQLDQQLETRLKRELGRGWHHANPSPILGETRPVPLKLSPLKNGRARPPQRGQSVLTGTASSPTFGGPPLSTQTASPNRGDDDDSAVVVEAAVDAFVTPVRKRRAALDNASPTITLTRSAPAHLKPSPQSTTPEPRLGPVRLQSAAATSSCTPPPGRVTLAPLQLDMKKHGSSTSGATGTSSTLRSGRRRRS